MPSGLRAKRPDRSAGVVSRVVEGSGRENSARLARRTRRGRGGWSVEAVSPFACREAATFYLAYIARPATDELKLRRAGWEKARAEHVIAADAIPGTLIFRDLPVPRNSFVMLRGQYDKPGDKVEPGVPAVFPPLKLADPTRRRRGSIWPTGSWRRRTR